MSHQRDNIVTEYYIQRIAPNKILTVFGFTVGDCLSESATFLSEDTQTSVILPFPSSDCIITQVPIDDSFFQNLSFLKSIETTTWLDNLSFFQNFAKETINWIPGLKSLLPKEKIVETECDIYSSVREIDWNLYNDRICVNRKRLVGRVYDSGHDIFICTIPSNAPKGTKIRCTPVAFVTEGPQTVEKMFAPGVQYPETESYISDWNTIVYTPYEETQILKGHNGKSFRYKRETFNVDKRTSTIFPFKDTFVTKLAKYAIKGVHPNCDLVIK
jgi:hypothetical protein